MQTSNRLFDDFAKVASGAMNTLGGLREEIETRVRERLERMAADMDLVTREEFDAVRAMATKARAEQEDMAGKLARLEAELAEVKARTSVPAVAAEPAPAPQPTRKPRAKKGLAAGEAVVDGTEPGDTGS